ncbi:MAG TPA: glycosyltransferase [Acetobacteraceae bacterium]|nr:glycosyltransferase [Acetobacteraceae bacterium]
MRVAIVCDSMSAYGGAERVIEQLFAIYPSADLFTVLDIVPANQRRFLEGRTINTSFLQNLPGISIYYRKLLHFWPLAVEQLDVTRYDLIISSHHSVAYGVLTRPGQLHVSYVHSPMRYAWDLQHQYLCEARLNYGIMGLMARRTLHKARIWDYSAAQRPDALATNSLFVAQRLWKTHRRHAEVIYPPVNVDRPRPPRHGGGYYLSLGRLVPYKRVDLLARAFAKMPERQLKIIGEGPDFRKIAALATPNVEVLGFRSDAAAAELLAGARAFLYAGIEDFGISAVEAQAAGTPVIAFRDGGLTETVIGLESGQPTGLFFDEQSESAIIDAVERFERHGARFTSGACIANAARFNEDRFREQFAKFVERVRLDCSAADLVERHLHHPPLAAPRAPAPVPRA